MLTRYFAWLAALSLVGLAGFHLGPQEASVPLEKGIGWSGFQGYGQCYEMLTIAFCLTMQPFFSARYDILLRHRGLHSLQNKGRSSIDMRLGQHNVHFHM